MVFAPGTCATCLQSTGEVHASARAGSSLGRLARLRPGLKPGVRAAKRDPGGAAQRLSSQASEQITITSQDCKTAAEAILGVDTHLLHAAWDDVRCQAQRLGSQCLCRAASDTRVSGPRDAAIELSIFSNEKALFECSGSTHPAQAIRARRADAQRRGAHTGRATPCRGLGEL